MTPPRQPPTLSVVIPALDAAAAIGGCLSSLEEARAAFGGLEVIVVDGGSRDGTPERATACRARVIVAPRGRGRQLAAGAAAAGGAWLLFLHADTRLAPGWAAEAAGFAGDPANARCAAVFRFALDHEALAARRLERLVALRCRVLALPYGDQGLFLARSTYRDVGGFRPLALMEDVDIVRRIGRRRLRYLGAAAITSARRYRGGGYVRRGGRNLACLSLYFLGVPPALIHRLYG